MEIKLSFFDGIIVTLNAVAVIGYNFSDNIVATPLACFHTAIVTMILIYGILRK